MAVRRAGQKQLHAWISDELKARLEAWRDEQQTTYTDILTEALEAHFDKAQAEAGLADRVARVERKLDRVLELLNGGDVDQADEEPRPTTRRNIVRRHQVNL